MNSLLQIQIFSWAQTMHHCFKVYAIAESENYSVCVQLPSSEDFNFPLQCFPFLSGVKGRSDLHCSVNGKLQGQGNLGLS